MPLSSQQPVVARLGDRVWSAVSPLVNWAVVCTPRGIVLVDAGYAVQAPEALESVRIAAEGAAAPDLVAILVTHAHTDHIGAIPAILERHPHVAVLAAEAEVAAVRGPEREQFTFRKMGLNLLRPKFLAWLRDGVTAGGLRETAIPSARAFTKAELDAFGIRAVSTPGHTAGSTSYEIIGDDVLVTGDAFVTDHLSYRRPRVGAIASHFSADVPRASRTAASITREMTIIPGHGPVLDRDRASP